MDQMGCARVDVHVHGLSEQQAAAFFSEDAAVVALAASRDSVGLLVHVGTRLTRAAA